MLIDQSVPFNFPEKGSQEVLNKDLPSFKVGVFEVTAKISATVYEEAADQVCIRGRIEAKWPGGSMAKDLDPNCHPIPPQVVQNNVGAVAAPAN